MLNTIQKTQIIFSPISEPDVVVVDGLVKDVYIGMESNDNTVLELSFDAEPRVINDSDSAFFFDFNAGVVVKDTNADGHVYTPGECVILTTGSEADIHLTRDILVHISDRWLVTGEEPNIAFCGVSLREHGGANNFALVAYFDEDNESINKYAIRTQTMILRI